MREAATMAGAGELPVSGNTTHTQPENRAFYPALDGMRALAFVMVFLHHYVHMPWGWAGVDLFFVLSGFLITGILFDTQHDRHRVRNFYVRRTLRIFPLYYGVLLLMLLLLPVAHWQVSWRWLIWPLYLGNWLRALPIPQHSQLERLADFQLVGRFGSWPVIMYLGHFWTLCVEEQFYLFWPFVVFAVRDRRRLLQICLGSLPVVLLLRVVSGNGPLTRYISDQALSHLTIFRLDALLAGGAIALLLRGPARVEVLRWGRLLFTPATIILLVYLFGLSPRRGHWFGYEYPHQTTTVGFTVIALFASLMVITAIQKDTWLARAFDQRPLRWMGRLSYGAYVFHDLLHHFYFHAAEALFGETRVGAAVIGFPATMLLAWASFRYFESPFLNLKERYTLRG